MITINEVQQMIEKLEAAGELSMKEEKYLALAKAFKQLAAENVALKSKGKELLGEACAVYSKLNKLIDPSIGDFVDGQTLHEFQFVLDVETPSTDRIVAGIKADGVEEWVSSRGGRWNGTTEEALKFAKQLREGKSEEVKS